MTNHDETQAAREWDSESRDSAYSTVADVEDETCEVCDSDACSCDEPAGRVVVTKALRDEAEAYYRLVREAEALGIPTSLDDPETPATVAALQAAVDHARDSFVVVTGSVPSSEIEVETRDEAISLAAKTNGSWFRADG